jgi:septum formation protein
MTTHELILASASPRRRELLTALGVTFRIVTSDVEEREGDHHSHQAPAMPALPTAVPPADHPTLVAWRKAYDVAPLVGALPILAADTTVVLDGCVFNKPRDAAHARAMLAELSGRRHTVLTGLCLLLPPDAAGERQALLHIEATGVIFRPLSADEIAAYVAGGEPLDKAGSYGFQGEGSRLVAAIEGSYTNVVGLPLPPLVGLLQQAGITAVRSPDAALADWLAPLQKQLPAGAAV